MISWLSDRLMVNRLSSVSTNHLVGWDHLGAYLRVGMDWILKNPIQIQIFGSDFKSRFIKTIQIFINSNPNI